MELQPRLSAEIGGRIRPGREALWKMFWEDILGKLDDPLPALNPRTRLVYDQPTWTGYEVVLDTGREGFAWGVLLLPKGMKPGERRRWWSASTAGTASPATRSRGDKPAYRNLRRPARRKRIHRAGGPHNLYQQEDNYRMLARKGHTVQATHWSVILRHHQQWLAWLGSQPQVDAKRIGFYGLELWRRIGDAAADFAGRLCAHLHLLGRFQRLDAQAGIHA